MYVARQGLPCDTAVARLGFKRRATAVPKSNLIQSIEFGTTVARRLKWTLDYYCSSLNSSHCKFGACQKWEPAGRIGDF